MKFASSDNTAAAIDHRLAMEIDLLLKFPDSSMEGLKIHHTADAAVIEAAQRLFDKALITHADGGYLTDLGREAADSASFLLGLLSPSD